MTTPHLTRRPRPRLLLVATLTIAVVAPLPATAAAARSRDFVTRTVSEPASAGLRPTGPLSEFVATSKARTVVPRYWRRLGAPAGQLRLAVTQSAACHYTVTYRVTTRVAPPQDAAAYVTAALPAPGPRYVLDEGTRSGNRAHRVIRQPSSGGQVRLGALWAGVLTRRPDIVPGGEQAWTELHVSAVSRAGDECHSGTWREVVGPWIADSLAVTRTSLNFVRAG